MFGLIIRKLTDTKDYLNHHLGPWKCSHALHKLHENSIDFIQIVRSLNIVAQSTHAELTNNVLVGAISSPIH